MKNKIKSLALFFFSYIQELHDLTVLRGMANANFMLTDQAS